MSIERISDSPPLLGSEWRAESFRQNRFAIRRIFSPQAPLHLGLLGFACVYCYLSHISDKLTCKRQEEIYYHGGAGYSLHVLIFAFERIQTDPVASISIKGWNLSTFEITTFYERAIIKLERTNVSISSCWIQLCSSFALYPNIHRDIYSLSRLMRHLQNYISS